MKSYFANSVQKAMEDARRELGDEAILVTSRLAPTVIGQPRRYEVVFATGVPDKPAKAESKPDSAVVPAKSATPNPAPAAPGLDAVLSEIREIRQQLESLRQTSRPLNEPRWAGDQSTRQLFAQLTAADVDPDLAQQLLAAAAKRVAQKSSAGADEPGGRFFEVFKATAGEAIANHHTLKSDPLREAVAAEIRDSFKVDTGFPAESGASVIAALIGPPGAGKTAAVAKLAIRYGLRLRRPALLISADTRRVAAAEQLRGYASVLGLRFELAQSDRALSQLIDEHKGNGLILIDTPGFSAYELTGEAANSASDMLRFLAQRSDIVRHLVIPAPARSADASRVSSAYEGFSPSHLIFSRFDETAAFGPMLNEAMTGGRPVSFFTTGQRVPEDIEEATADALIERLLPAPEPERRIAAAA